MLELQALGSVVPLNNRSRTVGRVRSHIEVHQTGGVAGRIGNPLGLRLNDRGLDGVKRWQISLSVTSARRKPAQK
jgi:hypothetical protein